MDQPAQFPDCNPIKHLWDELWRAINNMDHPSHNLHQLRQALLDQWANIPVDVMSPLIGRDRSYVTLMCSYKTHSDHTIHKAPKENENNRCWFLLLF